MAFRYFTLDKVNNIDFMIVIFSYCEVIRPSSTALSPKYEVLLLLRSS